MDMEKVIKGLEHCIRESEYIDDNPCEGCPYFVNDQYGCERTQMEKDALAMLKEFGKKEIKLHKKYILTLNRNDEFSMRKLYESVCEKLLDEGEMIITRTDNHENVEFVFYVVND